ncbi:hypothetical protein SUGI_0366180 [Cryptomeria japonica]|nr:hypothetical protein SUGI_0366180 [Cryptomeria japonica]
MGINCKLLSQNRRFIIINVYGPVSTIDKRDLWANISNWLKLQNDTKIIIGGDFNATLDNLEKQGGIQAIARVKMDLQNSVDENHLRDNPTKNRRFTSTNRRQGFTSISKRLDIFFLYGDWSNNTNSLKEATLQYTRSDHFLVELSIWLEGRKVGAHFKFENMWLRDPSIMDLMKAWWDEIRVGNHSNLYILLKKISHVKHKLRQWNKDHFKNIFEEKFEVKEELQ